MSAAPSIPIRTLKAISSMVSNTTATVARKPVSASSCPISDKFAATRAICCGGIEVNAPLKMPYKM